MKEVTRSKKLGKRVAAAMLKGNLTLSDMARWLGRTRPTIREWAWKGRAMNGADGEYERVNELLKTIEKRIQLGKGLPVPYFPTTGKVRAPTQRIIYLNKLMARKKM